MSLPCSHGFQTNVLSNSVEVASDKCKSHYIMRCTSKSRQYHASIRKPCTLNCLARHENDLSYQLIQHSIGSQKSLASIPDTLCDELIDVHSINYFIQIFIEGLLYARDCANCQDITEKNRVWISYWNFPIHLFIHSKICIEHDCESIPVLETTCTVFKKRPGYWERGKQECIK